MTGSVCILTCGQIGSNPRVVKEADALHDAGFDVTVIAPRTLDLVDRHDEALMSRIGWRLRRLDFRAASARLAPRLTQLCACLAFSRLGWESAAFLGTNLYTSALVRAAQHTPAQLYIAHYPGALPAAAMAARAHGAKYGYDAEDYHLGDWPKELAYDDERRIIRAIERRLLPACAYVSAASSGIAKAYAEEYDIAYPTVLLNVFPIAQAPNESQARDRQGAGPSIYWFSQTIGPDRGLECAVRAIARAKTQPHLYLRGTPAAGYVDVLTALGGDLGVKERMHILPPTAPDYLERAAAAFDVGLASETGHTAARKLCLTNKLFSYLLAGLPPLLSDTPAQREFAVEAGLIEQLYPVDDDEALADRIDGLVGCPNLLAAARAHVRRLAFERYNWDHEKEALLESVRRAIG